MSKAPLAPLPEEPKPGSWWRHPKTGNKYMVEELSYSAEDGSHEVRYRNVQGVPFTRRHVEWFQEVMLEGEMRQRFEPLPAEEVPANAQGLTVFEFRAGCTLPENASAGLLGAAGMGVGETLTKLLLQRATLRGEVKIRVTVTARPAPGIALPP